MASYQMSDDERAALSRILSCARHRSSSGRAARQLICAWYNATSFGGLDLSDLWLFDAANRRAASTVLTMIAHLPDAVYPHEVPGFEQEVEEVLELERTIRRANETP